MAKIALDLQNNRFALNETSRVGRIGEQYAAGFLARNKFRLVGANFKTTVGRNRRGAAVSGEIDLIALDGDVLCFVEVKTRSSDEFAAPLAAVGVKKQRQITRTARIYRRVFNLRNVKFRFDVVSIVLQGNAAPKIELFRGFWTEAKFKKRSWSGRVVLRKIYVGRI